MNSDTMIRQLAEGDIYAPEHDLPETARTSTVALTEIRRRIDMMDAKELTKPVEQEPKRRSGWLVAATAFGGVVLVVGLIAVINSGDANESTATTTPASETLPTTTQAVQATTTTVDASAVTAAELALVDAFVEAWNSGRRDALEAVVDDTATMSVLPWSNPEGFQWMVDLMRSHRLMQSQMSIDGCRRSGDKVFCSIYLDGPVEQALTQATMRYQGLFLLAEDRILSLDAACVVCPDLVTFDDARRWVATLDEDLADQMAWIPFEPHS
ncbi:MAG: nuclear transport factor 2 family protein, partial [Acidimicrobiia bacterium]